MPVFHLDIEAFMSSVTRLKDRELARRPVVIAPPKPRAHVLGASCDAKALGIARGMPIHQVQRFFPGVAIIAPNYGLFDAAQARVLDVARRYSPTVEPVAYGHVALDMVGMSKLFPCLSDAALAMRREVEDAVSLASTVGIASNKLVSTIAAKRIQSEGEPLCQVDDGTEPDFLSPLPCKALPDWEQPGTRRLLFELNLQEIGQVQEVSRELFGFAMGEDGIRLHRHAHGIDTSPVTAPDQANRIRAEHHFCPDTNDDEVLLAALQRLVEKLCFQLRAKGLLCDRVRVGLRYADDVVSERQYLFHRSQREEAVMLPLRQQFQRLCARRRRVRHLWISLGGLCQAQVQLDLFRQNKSEAISPQLDRIRHKFGATAVQSGNVLAATLKNGNGPRVPAAGQVARQRDLPIAG